MPQRVYNWSRKWFERENEQTFSKVELSSLLEIPCLVLLGEPGMGKSYALHHTFEQLSNDETDQYVFRNLAHFESAEELRQEIFKSEIFREWQEANFVLHLFLDSLDEGRIQIKTLAEKLTKYFEENVEHLGRLRVRITCRSTDWPSDFEDNLRSLWGQQNVKVYVLAPLQRQEIVQAASQIEQISNVNKFWEEVIKKDAIPFAERPTTLNFLLDEYVSSGQLPHTKKELYEKGCRGLCTEFNAPHAKLDQLKPEHRYIVASRIAATMIFTGYSGVRLKTLSGINTKTLTKEDFARGKEIFNDLEFYVHEDYIQETLDTALFQGEEIREWAQQTYAEFLAAWYVSHILSPPQIKSLIFHPEGKLIPQLHETSAWIATFKPEVFNWILESDPEVLLRSDVAIGDELSREKLVTALLEWRDQNPYNYFEWKYLSSLNCRNLSQILRHFIQDKSKRPETRDLGIDIAIACQQAELQESMVEVALNSDEVTFVRQSAAQFIVEIGNEDTKRRLRPIAFLSLEKRELGELKRYGILATWPNHLTTPELFSTLVAPGEGDKLIDRYITQNWSELILPKLQVNEIPIALEWVRSQKFNHYSGRSFSHTFSELLDAIFYLAWQHLRIPEITAAFCHALIPLWKKHNDVIIRKGTGRNISNNPNVLTPEIVFYDDERRYLLLQHLIPIASVHSQMGHNFIHDLPLITSKDTSWLINYYTRSTSPQEKNLVIELLQYSVRIYEPEQFQFIYEIGQQNPELWNALSYKLFYEFDAEESQKAKEYHHLLTERDLRREEFDSKPEKQPLIPTAKERVLDCLDNFERGNLESWIQMSYWMMVNSEGDYLNIHYHEFDFFGLPVWHELNELEKLRIINSAPLFLQQCNPDKAKCNNSWWEKRTLIFWPIVAGCRAIFSLNIEQFNLLSAKDWKKWAPAFTYYVYESLVYINEESKRKQKTAFLKFFKAIAPEEVNETILWIAECENNSEHFFIISRLDDLLDKPLAELFIKSIENNKYKSNNESQILRTICRIDVDWVRPILKSWIRDSTFKLDRKQLACQLLLAFFGEEGWKLVWPEIQSDIEFGKKVIEGVVSLYHSSGIMLHNLSEVELATLYIWLYQQYPPEKYFMKDGWVDTQQEIVRFRDSLPARLAERGTKESIYQLTNIQKILNRDMSYSLGQGSINYLQNTWQPLKPIEFRELIQNKRTRWIQSGAQLVEAIIELLRQLNLELQGQSGATPSAIELWNEDIRKVDKGQNKFYKPKDENRLSDYVERFLKRNLEGQNIFISRENQVRRGSLTDIYIETKPLLSRDQFGQPITVVLETKGCWNPELKTAMQEQLKNRYLVQNGLRYGIYLIGRFMCDSWDKNDKNRWNASVKFNDDELLDLVKSQASQLSIDGYDIRPFILNAKL